MISRPMANITPTAERHVEQQAVVAEHVVHPAWPLDELDGHDAVVDGDERQRAPLGPREPVQRDAGATPTTAPRTITCRAPGGRLRLATHEYTPTPVVPSTAPHRAKTMNRGRFDGAEEQPGGEQQHGDDGDDELDADRPRRPGRCCSPSAAAATSAVSASSRPSRPAGRPTSDPRAGRAGRDGTRRSRRAARATAAPRTKPRKPALTVECPAAPSSAATLVARPRAAGHHGDRHAAVIRASRRTPSSWRRLRHS